MRDLTPATLQRYFSSMAKWTLGRESRDKIRDVLSSVLRTASKKYGLLVGNPMEGIELPPSKTGKRKTKPHITPEQFDELVNEIPEPYSTMVYVATYSGLRISELIGLKWNDLGVDSITVDERYCRGDWAEPKKRVFRSNDWRGSPCDRAHPSPQAAHRRSESRDSSTQIQSREVERPGRSDLSGRPGRSPQRDNNILTRFIKPAGRKLGIGFVNWRSLRTSRATWMIEAGANPKDVQGQMRHSRIQTTLDIYAQFVPDSQRRAVEQTSKMAAERIANARAARAAVLTGMVN